MFRKRFPGAFDTKANTLKCWKPCGVVIHVAAGNVVNTNRIGVNRVHEYGSQYYSHLYEV